MKILGIESSCDECSSSIVDEGRVVLSLVVASQIEQHSLYGGVVPEIASRLHTEWIGHVVERAFHEASLEKNAIDGVAVTHRPGLLGSLLVGISFAKGFAFTLGVPYVGVDHVKAHLYAPHLEQEIPYPYLGVVISGGHTLLFRVEGPTSMTVLGTTIDDACGEAFDKVAKHYGWGYPGGVAIDRLAQKGNGEAFAFPHSSLRENEGRYNVSYSGLKTAVIHQLDRFWNGSSEKSPENVAASFQKTAIDMVMSRIKKALGENALARIVVGGGVAANSYLRSCLESLPADVYFPSLKLCGDNGAMIAGLGFHILSQEGGSSYALKAFSRSLDAYVPVK